MLRACLLLFLLGLCSACTGAFLAAAPTGDVGTLGVSGLQGGVGGHLEIGLLREREGSALLGAATAALAGFASEGDADPVLFTALEVRYRRWLGSPAQSARLSLEAGGGPVVAWVAGPRAGGLSGHIAAGLQGGGPDLQWFVALRERPAGLIGGGQPEFFNSIQTVFGLALKSVRGQVARRVRARRARSPGSGRHASFSYRSRWSLFSPSIWTIRVRQASNP
jgi:hypothetical protein